MKCSFFGKSCVRTKCMVPYHFFEILVETNQTYYSKTKSAESVDDSF